MTTTIRPKRHPVPKPLLKANRHPIPQHPTLQPWHVTTQGNHNFVLRKGIVPFTDATSLPAQDTSARSNSDSGENEAIKFAMANVSLIRRQAQASRKEQPERTNALPQKQEPPNRTPSRSAPEKSRLAMQKQKLPALTPAHIAFDKNKMTAEDLTTRHVIPLYAIDENKERYALGSALLLQITAKKFLISAAHVFDENKNAKNPTDIEIPGANTFIPVHGSVIKSPLPPSGKRADDKMTSPSFTSTTASLHNSAITPSSTLPRSIPPTRPTSSRSTPSPAIPARSRRCLKMAASPSSQSGTRAHHSFPSNTRQDSSSAHITASRTTRRR
jgi:hypothetical protein